MDDAVFYTVVFLLIVLFVGDPDLHDALMVWLRK